jgi:transcription antitermination factor NusA-like protein
MAKKQTATSEITSATGAAAAPARAEKPTAKRATTTKHSAKNPVANVTKSNGEEIAVLDRPVIEPVDVVLDREEVAKLAYLYWEARGCQSGSAELDWARAEEELRKKN